MDAASPKARKGFAAMDPDKRREIARKGGASVPPDKRSFSTHAGLAIGAGSKGGSAPHVSRGKRPIKSNT